MKLPVPVFHLKRKAKLLSREQKIPLHRALDRIALQEGFDAWSLLAAKRERSAPAGALLSRFAPGDLVLLAARPRQGKTLMSLALAARAMRRGRRAAVFTLESTEKEILDRLDAIGVEPSRLGGSLELDCSDRISADHIITTLASAPRGTLVVVDYLQLLDQKRENPELAVQVRALKAFAQDRGLIVIAISQIDRAYDLSQKPFPDARDVRLPNPLDLGLFSKTCFLSNGEVRLS